MIVFEYLQIIVLIVLFSLLIWRGSLYRAMQASGWYWLLAGFLLLAGGELGGVVKVPTESMASPLLLLIVNNMPALLMLAGYIALTVGLLQWTPLFKTCLEQQHTLHHQNEQLTAFQATLNQSEARFAILFNHAPVGMFTFDSSGQILEVNAAYANLLGYSCQELYEFPLIKTTHPQDVNEQQQLCEALELGQCDHYHLEKRLICKDDSIVWVAMNVAAVRNSQNNVLTKFGIVQDITVHKNIELQLRQAHEQLTCHLEKSPLGVIEWDAELRVRRWTPQASVIFGWQADAVLGKHFAEWEFLHEKERAVATATFAKLLKGEISQTVQHWHTYTESHKVIYCEWHISVCNLSSNITADLTEQAEQADLVSLLTFVHDITEREKLHQELQDNQTRLGQANAELQHANRLKDEFLANMSHELRTPLSSILGMAEVLNDRIYGEINERQQKAIERIYTSGQHLLALINDILDLARIEANKTELQLAPVAVREVCQSGLIFIKEQAHKKRIGLEMDTSQGPEMINADMRRLNQILVNLLNNAVKFTPVGGKIGMTVTQDTRGQSVKFTVWDTGIGIDAADMQQLFKPFTQVDSSFTRNYEGTGLGLALVQRLTELHGGSIEVHSELQKGSRFSVILPQHQEALVQQPPRPRKPEEVGTLIPGQSESPIGEQPPLIGKSRIILLAEDNPSNIETLVAYLRHKRYRVNIARTGVEVLESLEETLPDVIVMDIQMPEMDGLEATRRIRANPNWCEIPIIALTALTMPGDQERCFEAGVNEYLSKPISLKTLYQLIEQQFQNKDAESV